MINIIPRFYPLSLDSRHIYTENNGQISCTDNEDRAKYDQKGRAMPKDSFLDRLLKDWPFFID